jgi:hypothetical protein
MAGKLDLPDPKNETPRPQIRQRNEKPAPKSTQYSAVLPVADSPKPPPSVADQAEAHSNRERLEREFNKAARGGKSRRRKTKKSKKTKRRHIK